MTAALTFSRLSVYLLSASLVTSVVGCTLGPTKSEKKDVEYAVEGAGGTPESKAPSMTSQRSGPTLPTEAAPTDSQSSMSQGADSPSASDFERSDDVASEVYPIPSGSKTEGEVRVTALGLTDLKIRGDGRNLVSALHLRIEAKNETGRSDWNVDSRLQQLRFSGSGDQLRPLFVQAESQSLPFIKVGVGKTVAIDLFYAIPKSISPTNAPSFELNWTLLASDESIAKTTAFKRLYPESREQEAYPFEQPESAPSEKPDPATKGTPMLREWWQDPYGYATPGSPVFNTYQ